MKLDGRSLPHAETLSCDVGIVGAGAAGITLARELAQSSLSVCLLESGGLLPDAESQDLYRGEIAGHDYFRGLEGSRLRFFGGSTNHWTGWCRPLDPADLRERAWLPGSGWPIAHRELRAHYGRAAEICELADPGFDREPGADASVAPPLSAPGLANVLYQLSPPTRFGLRYRAELLRARRVRCVLFANATEIEPDASRRRIERIRVATLSGNHFFLRARTFVLATGGIENPRILLASRRRTPAGLGNDHDLVGRYFLEHTHAKPLLFIPAPQLDLRRYLAHATPGARHTLAIVPSDAALERAGLARCSFTIDPYEAPEDAWPEGSIPNAMPEHESKDTGLAGGVASLLRAWTGWGGPAQAIHRLTYRGEQVPNAESRITLARDLDPLGMPRAQLHWALQERDIDNIREASALVARAFGAASLGRVGHGRADTGEPTAVRVIGGSHHMGTTRMALDPRHGVVDEHGRVHGIENLYIAGSSVFPTAGFANPTLTIVALALRLADRIRENAP